MRGPRLRLRLGLTETPGPDVNFTTLVGDLFDLLTIADTWESFRVRLPVAVGALTIMPMPGEPAGQPRGPLTGLRVGVVLHAARAADLVARVTAEYVEGVARAPVRVDPGYWLAPASATTPPSAQMSWRVVWNTSRVSALRAFPPPTLPNSVAGALGVSAWPRPVRVLLIDTGDERAAEQEAFVLSRTMGTRDQPPYDWHGHGTSLADVVRLRAPHAVVTSVRVFEKGEQYSASAALLNGLIYATHGMAEANVVGVAQRALVTGDTARFAETLSYILAKAVGRQSTMPVVVCAAGNTRDGALMALPATVPGVLVARAISWNGEVLEYNCTPPRGRQANVVDAYGGVENDLLGEAYASDGRTVRMFGSSYAAALAVGALAAV